MDRLESNKIYSRHVRIPWKIIVVLICIIEQNKIKTEIKMKATLKLVNEMLV